MKKRIITLLAILALLVTCAVFAVQADPTDPTYIDLATFKCPCSACTAARETNPEYVLPVDQWVTTYTHSPAAGGHYYYTSSAAPGSQSSITKAGEVVIVLDNASLSFGGSGRALRVGATATTKLHLIGNNGGLYYKGSGTGEGIIVQVDTKAEMHIYGDLTIGKAAEATGVTTSGGLVKVAAGKFHIHDCDGMGLPTDKDPVLNAPALANTTSSLGGIATLTSSTASFVMDAGTLNGTSTCYRGGVFNIGGATVTINGGTINGGIAGNRGGAIMLSSGTLNIGGTAVINANANMTANYRGVTMNGGTFNFSGGTINSCNKGLGDGIAITKGTLNLSGNATVQNAAGTKTNNIWRWNDASNTSVIQVDSEWSGTASISLPGFDLENHGNALASSVLYFGTLSNGTFTDGTSTTAEKIGLYLENADHEYPQMAGYTRYIVTCRAGLYEDGALKDWYVTPGNAIGAYVASEATSKYIKLWADYGTAVDTEVYMDLNGRDITKMTKGEEGKIYAFDSTAEVGGVGATISAEVEPATQIGGKTYVVKDGTIYPVDLKITGVSLRPTATAAGLYYSAKLVANEGAGLTKCGVAVTTKGADKTDLNADFLYTEQDVTADEFNGVLVSGIIKESNEPNTNKENIGKHIYAKAYITLADGTNVLSEAVDWTLGGVIEEVQKLTDLDEKQTAALASLTGAEWYTDINTAE